MCGILVVQAMHLSTCICGRGVGLHAVYCKQYDKYHDTHEPIFDTYQRYTALDQIT